MKKKTPKPAPEPKKSANVARVNLEMLDAWNASRIKWRFPDGFYCDTPYICRTCGEVKIWTAPQQKYWFEEKQGRSDSTAVYCPECRETYRQIKTEARRISAEGLARKRARQAQNNP
ncbi:hypothetical protein FACS1894185_4530 [Betaproteobacteria bacterium]|nr:hypothetical protein FACS1894185_4530 [Betaproteobacteria bacterium]